MIELRFWVVGVALLIAQLLSHASVHVKRKAGGFVVSNRHFEVVHDAQVEGGLPSQVRWRATGRSVKIKWHDRAVHIQNHARQRTMISCLHSAHRPSETAWVRWGRATVRLVQHTRARAVVEVQVALRRTDGHYPSGKLRAIYRFTYNDSPLVVVESQVFQDKQVSWTSLEWFALSLPDDAFNKWYCDYPAPLLSGWDRQFFEGERNQKLRFLTDIGGWRIPNPHRSHRWAAVGDGDNALAVLSATRLLIGLGWHDWGVTVSNNCQQLQAVIVSPWDGEERELRAWLWIGTASGTELRATLDRAWAGAVADVDSRAVSKPEQTHAKVRKYALGEFALLIESSDHGAMLAGISFRDAQLVGARSSVRTRIAEGRRNLRPVLQRTRMGKSKHQPRRERTSHSPIESQWFEHRNRV